MTSYEADVYFITDSQDYFVVDADDADDAEFKITDLVKERYPYARAIQIENMKEIKR